MPLNLDKLKTPQGKRDAILGAIAVALAVDVATRIAADDPQRETKLADLGKALATDTKPRPQRADNLDTGELHRVVKAIRATDPQLVDLGGMLVQPGATVEAGGNLDKGATLVAWPDGCADLGGVYHEPACILGPGAASWAVLSSSCTDRDDATWCAVTLRNDAKEPQRPVVFVRRTP